MLTIFKTWLKTLLIFLLIPTFLSLFDAEVGDVVPVVHTSIAGCRIVGRLCVGECVTEALAKWKQSLLSTAFKVWNNL